MTVNKQKQEGLHQTPDANDTDNALIQEFKKARRYKGDDACIVKRSKGEGKAFNRKRKVPEPQVFPTDEEGKPDWKKVKLESKLLKTKRKQSNVGNDETYELSVKAKKVWEELRREDCEKERKQKLCDELYKLIEGKVAALIYAHDTVRVIETLIAHGGEKYRSYLFVELQGQLQTLSKNKYSRFFILKLLRYGTRLQKDAIINSLLGNIGKLMRSKIASDVVELSYNDYANAKQRSSMIQEFFGPRFRHFKQDVTSLSEAIEKFPEHKEGILTDVYSSLVPIIEKGIFRNTLIHTLLRQYLECSEGAERGHIIEALREELLPIVHTRDGARVTMMCLWFGTAKDRKLLLRKFKGHFLEIALEEHGHLILLAAFDCLDDTVFVKKAILDELLSSENLAKLAKSEIGKKVLKYLIVPRNALFFHPDVISILSKGDGNMNSKKDCEIRRKELLSAVEVPVLELLKKNVSIWANSSQWTLFIGAALQHFDHEIIRDIFSDLADICAEPFVPGNDDHFLQKSFMNKMFSFLIECDKQRFADEKEIFSRYLITATDTEMPSWVMSNRGCFILVKLIETEILEVKDPIIELITPLIPKLKKLKFVGASILLKKLE